MEEIAFFPALTSKVRHGSQIYAFLGVIKVQSTPFSVCLHILGLRDIKFTMFFSHLNFRFQIRYVVQLIWGFTLEPEPADETIPGAVTHIVLEPGLLFPASSAFFVVFWVSKKISSCLPLAAI